VESFKEIWERAAKRHGGEAELEARMPTSKKAASLARTPDHRVLSAMTRAVFQAGFVWRVVEHKWDGFEEAFAGFEPQPIAKLSEQRLAELARDERIIRNPQKIRATRENARLLVELAEEHGSAARCLARWPQDDIVGLWDLLKRRGSRLGGNTGPFFLRHIGKDTPLLTGDVIRALREQGVIDQKSPTSKKALARVQNAFNTWCQESGRSLSEVSRTLGCSVGDIYSAAH
jgi:3-methyladenine DNA glycosylase Tag